MRKLLWVLSFTFVLVCCSKASNFFYLHPTPSLHTQTQLVKQVSGTNNLDILWVIGGMTEQAQNFQNGIQTFMSTFTTKSYQWRMAVSGSNLDGPQLGMPTIFDNTDPNPTQDFVTGVVNALNSLDEEMIFDPAQANLQQYAQFVRPNADLVLLLTNDAPDSSFNVTTAAQMMTFLKGIKGGNSSKIYVYGIFGATDLNCQDDQIDEEWNFHGSEFENLINMTGGQVYSLCDASFGTQLAKLGDDLYKHMENPRIQLDSLPDPNTIQVSYQGTPLPGGPQASGGMWYYDVNGNAVVFYNLDFAKNDTDTVTITYADYQAVQ